jgi:bacterioferritin-associated ferredoxin
MYLCVCHAVKEGATDKYHLIGKACGRCLPYLESNVYPGTKISVNYTELGEKK